MYIARQLGRYHLLDRIAVGGMAEIYRAKTFDSRGEEHLVAIKRVLAHLAEDDDFLQMLVDEAKIATLLDHPNIAKVYEFVRVEEEYFMAMEYVDGRDLRSLLDRSRAQEMEIPVEHCAYIVMRALEALHAAHSKTDGAGEPLNIVHRDISPSNVIVSYSGQVKLCDFGIAKAKLSRVQTRVGVIKGKVKYMSPEQAMGHTLDGRSDVFSCGSVLYELLTKQAPFSAENEMALIFRVRDAKTSKPSRINPNIPAPLEKVLRKMMNRSLGGRYATAGEAAGALRGFLQEHAPDYTPGKLGRFLRNLFSREIERDLRKLEEFVIQRGDPAAMGFNLLAEVLGEGAPYTRFTPMPLVTELREQQEEALETRLMPRVPAPETRLPADVDLHELKTEIIDQEEREGRILKRKHRKRPGANHHRDRLRDTQAGTGVYDLAHQALAPPAGAGPAATAQPMLGQPPGPPPSEPPPGAHGLGGTPRASSATPAASPGPPHGAPLPRPAEQLTPPPARPPGSAVVVGGAMDGPPTITGDSDDTDAPILADIDVEAHAGGLAERPTSPRDEAARPHQGAPVAGAIAGVDTDLHGLATNVFDLPESAEGEIDDEKTLDEPG